MPLVIRVSRRFTDCLTPRQIRRAGPATGFYQ
jgi:hypothetical protein